MIVLGALAQPTLPHPVFAFAAASASFVLAAISFRVIETPLRYGTLTRQYCLPKAAAAMLLAGLLPAWTLTKLNAPASADPSINRVLSFNFYNP